MPTPATDPCSWPSPAAWTTRIPPPRPSSVAIQRSTRGAPRGAGGRSACSTTCINVPASSPSNSATNVDGVVSRSSWPAIHPVTVPPASTSIASPAMRAPNSGQTIHQMLTANGTRCTSTASAQTEPVFGRFASCSAPVCACRSAPVRPTPSTTAWRNRPNNARPSSSGRPRVARRAPACSPRSARPVTTNAPAATSSAQNPTPSIAWGRMWSSTSPPSATSTNASTAMLVARTRRAATASTGPMASARRLTTR